MASLRRTSVLVAFLIGCAPGYAAPWLSYGPNGGDARAFAADPNDPAHLYMGSANGWLFETHDQGKTWHRLARLGDRDDLVIDHILMDHSNAKRLIVAGWVLGSGKSDGGIYISDDGGLNWTGASDMQGQSVRALVVDPSEPGTLVAGTLEGVFRSTDNGVHWQRISPKENREIHEVESLAVDPVDSKKIFAGTWHLPWKTTDGGATWSSMSDGLIEDSDIFSIIIDQKQPSVVYLSACSGIYKSEDGGGKFIGGVSHNKLQGIPVDARRTRVLKQDPNHPDTVYAGTTEGLYRTIDAGKTWTLRTAPTVIVNDVYVDPSNSDHVMLATDRGGVLLSGDSTASFVQSNEGFSARQITAFAADTHNAATVYVGVVNDKELGGVFVSRAGGMSWSQLSNGLAGNDVNALVQAPDGAILAGTGHGVYRLQDEMWKRQGTETKPTAKAAVHPVAAAEKPVRGKRKPPVKRVATYANEDVYGFITSGSNLYAASSAGLLTSANNGSTWIAVEAVPQGDWRAVASTKEVVVAADWNATDNSTLAVSNDAGKTWSTVATPPKSSQVLALAVDGDGGIWMGDRNSIYYSTDKGTTWQELSTQYVRNVRSLYYDQPTNRILATAKFPEKEAFAIDPATQKITAWDTGWSLRFVRPVGNYLVGATLFDGLVVQPRMVDSAEVAKP